MGKGCVCHTVSLEIKEKISRLESNNQNTGKQGETGFGSRKAAVKNTYHLSSLSCRRLSGSLIMQTVQISRISPKCSLFRPAGEVSTRILKAMYLACH